MTTHDLAPDDNRELFARLRQMWSRRDPMPPGLVDDILVALATEDIGEEYALLTLVEYSNELSGVRSLADARTLEFSDGAVTILLRVSAAASGKRRIDGWLAPASFGTLRLELDGQGHSVETSASGRFAFADVPNGRAQMWLEAAVDDESSAWRRGFTTPEFDI